MPRRVRIGSPCSRSRSNTIEKTAWWEGFPIIGRRTDDQIGTFRSSFSAPNAQHRFAYCIHFERYAHVLIGIRRSFGQPVCAPPASMGSSSKAKHVRKKSEANPARKTLKLRRAGLHVRAAERMRAMIISGELAPGSLVQETRLSEALGVSRTPLREAMKVLAAEGLVELRPNRSPRIAEIEMDRMFELFEALAGIERLAAELAAQRATDRELQRLRLLQNRMEGHHREGRLAEYFAINGEIQG